MSDAFYTVLKESTERMLVRVIVVKGRTTWGVVVKLQGEKHGVYFM